MMHKLDHKIWFKVFIHSVENILRQYIYFEWSRDALQTEFFLSMEDVYHEWQL